MESEDSKPEHVSRSLGAVIECAQALARKNNLVCRDGTVACWSCGVIGAPYPALHCADCLATAKRPSDGYRTFYVGDVKYTCLRASQNDLTWAAMKRDMADSPSVDKPIGVAWLAKAREMPEPQGGDYAELSEIFRRRFPDDDSDGSPLRRTKWRSGQ